MKRENTENLEETYDKEDLGGAASESSVENFDCWVDFDVLRSGGAGINLNEGHVFKLKKTKEILMGIRELGILGIGFW